uniref:Uncharacterized protein n=1 Tax=Lotus japonicus TaxID=34305 RepID=I3RZL7_LOTJA|nr:unknown [Lotus japonicus]
MLPDCPRHSATESKEPPSSYDSVMSSICKASNNTNLGTHGHLASTCPLPTDFHPSFPMSECSHRGLKCFLLLYSTERESIS